MVTLCTGNTAGLYKGVQLRVTNALIQPTKGEVGADINALRFETCACVGHFYQANETKGSGVKSMPYAPRANTGAV